MLERNKKSPADLVEDINQQLIKIDGILSTLIKKSKFADSFNGLRQANKDPVKSLTETIGLIVPKLSGLNPEKQAKVKNILKELAQDKAALLNHLENMRVKEYAEAVKKASTPVNAEKKSSSSADIPLSIQIETCGRDEINEVIKKASDADLVAAESSLASKQKIMNAALGGAPTPQVAKQGFFGSGNKKLASGKLSLEERMEYISAERARRTQAPKMN